MVTNITEQKDDFISELNTFIAKWMSKGESISIGKRMYGVKTPMVFVAIEGVKVTKLDEDYCRIDRL